MKRILVTGANGFVGRALCRVLTGDGHAVTGLVRLAGACAGGVDEWVESSRDFAGLERGWPEALRVDCVVHLAARVHVLHDDAADPDAAFRATNVDGALRVAEAAFHHGAQRFVFVSSIKATAEADAGRPLREDDKPAPQDAYGRSKLAAEQTLVRFGEQAGMEIVIVRPPLVYGPEVRANFLRLMDGIWKGVPFPLASVEARRSLVYVDNLADALMHCAIDSRAANQCFHVADGEDPTVAGLARALARHLQKPARLLPVPVRWLRLAGRMTNRTQQIERLVGSLQVDTSRIRSQLNWRPPHSLDDGLAATARWYRSMH